MGHLERRGLASLYILLDLVILLYQTISTLFQK